MIRILLFLLTCCITTSSLAKDSLDDLINESIGKEIEKRNRTGEFREKVKEAILSKKVKDFLNEKNDPCEWSYEELTDTYFVVKSQYFEDFKESTLSKMSAYTVQTTYNEKCGTRLQYDDKIRPTYYKGSR